jgi:hypothetical protein
VPNVRTASQAKAENILKMGQELGDLYSALWQEIAWIHSKWDEYVVLYGTKPERIDLLNRAAPAFFRLIQDVLWEDIVLHIARLTDSPKSLGKPNLSINRLAPLITDASLCAKVELLVATCVSASEFAKDWRNKHLAHRDLARAIAEVADPLMPASRAHVVKVLTSLTDLLNSLSLHYFDSTTFFEGTGSLGDAESLLYILDDGLKVADERRQRVESGVYDQKDIAKREL